MQKSTPLLAGLMLVLACCPALAEVTYEPQALDRLSPESRHPAEPAPHPSKPPAPRRVTVRHEVEKPRPARPVPVKAAPVKPAQPVKAAAPPPQPVVPLAPPPLPVIPPPIFVPVRPDAPPPPATITADAPGVATPLPGGLRIGFGAGRADLNPATAAALRALAAGRPPGTSFTISAYAPGAAEDPSTPRRLSLSRALTVRSLLIAQGIPSERIYPKPLGAGPGIADGPPDRADVIVAPPPAQTAAASAPAGPKAAQ